MTIRITALILAAAFAAGNASAQTSRQVPVHIGLVYPISSNGLHAPAADNRFSLHALAGVSHSEQGVAIAGLSNVIISYASGLQVSGLFNHIGGNARGLQVAGLLNLIGGEASGVQVAGFANITNRSGGMQVAGFINSSKRYAGVQIAGFANTARKANMQLSGFVNVAEQVKGMQLAGFVNVARKVDGLQIAGFINVADSSDCPIGLINIIKNGEQAIGTTVDETRTQLVAFRSGGRRLYGILGAGANFRDRHTLYALEAGLGGRLPILKNIRINVEASVLSLTDFRRGSYLRSSLRLLPEFRVGPVGLFAGPSFNCVTLSRNTGYQLVADYTWSERGNRGHFTGLYFGGIAGIQYYF